MVFDLVAEDTCLEGPWALMIYVAGCYCKNEPFFYKPNWGQTVTLGLLDQNKIKLSSGWTN